MVSNKRIDKRARVLIVDDEQNMRHFLSALLVKEGYLVDTANSGVQALEFLQQAHYDFLLCDIRMPEMDGLQMLEALSEFDNLPLIIMMSAYGTVDIAVEAMKKGAYDYISKPFKTDEILLVIKKAEERQKLQKENERLRRCLHQESDTQVLPGMIGSSPKLTELGKVARQIAPFPSTVLITGDSGTGKELVARAIHALSSRSEQQFLAINCGGLPESLVESELFGYVKGAFTGADKDKKGLFEEANTGTLFLDEIGELPMQTQVTLLRVLQEREIRRVGAAQSSPVDVRVIAATARDLEVEVQEKRFREDLFFRLNVVHLKVPALKSRPEDIAELSIYFMERFAYRFGKQVDSITTAAMASLIRYDWPGNVRELKNIIERAVLLTDSSEIDVESLSTNIQGLGGQSETITGQLSEIFSIKEGSRLLEKELITKALISTHGNKSKAAALLEISYPSLLNKIKEYAIR